MIPLRVVNHPPVAALGGLDTQLALRDVTETVRLLGRGEADMPAETCVALDTPRGKAYSLPARVGGRFNCTGVKWTAHRPEKTDSLPQALTLTLLNRADDGVPIGLLESGGLTAVRTAAVSALALRLAAPRPVTRVLLLGAGVQAAAHLAMLQTHFPALEQVWVWNRTPARRLHAASAPFPVIPLELADALRQPWDALIACTSASVPFIGPDVVCPGRIVLQIGYHEVEFAAIRRATQVVVDGWGDFCHTSAKSLFQMFRAGEFAPTQVAATLVDLVTRHWRARPDDAVYFSSFGLNVFDIALAARVLQEAERQQAGVLLPLSGGLPEC